MLFENNGTDKEKASGADSAEVLTPHVDFPSFDELMKPKSTVKRMVSRLVSIVLVLAFLSVAVIGFWPYIANSAMYIFASPENHQKYVYMRSAEDMTERAVKLFSAGQRLASRSYSGSADIQLTYVSKNLLTTLLGLDESLVDAVSDIGIDYKYIGNQMEPGIDLGIALKDLSLRGELRTDIAENDISVSLPDMSDKALYVDLDDKQMLEEAGFDPRVGDIFGYSAAAFALVPDEELIRYLIPEYTERLFSQIKNVEREKCELTVGEVTQKTFCFTSTLDADALNSSALAMLEAMTKDERIRKHILVSFERIIKEGNSAVLDSLLSAEGDASDAKDYYELLTAKAELLKKSIKESKSDHSLILKTYADGKGDITAMFIECEIDTEEGTQLCSFTAARTRDGNKAGFEISCELDVLTDSDSSEEEAEDNYTSISVIGSGIEKSDVFDGEIDIVFTRGTRQKPDIREIATVVCEDLELESLEEGNLKGKFTAKSGSYFDDLLGDLEGKAMSKCRIIIDADCTDDADKYDIRVMLGDNMLGSIAVSGAWGESEDSSLHTNTLKDPYEWLGSLDISEILPFIMQFAEF